MIVVYSGGDFNATVSFDEREGGSINKIGVSNLFNNFLFHMDPAYTWHRGSLKQRLDRCICNGNWLMEFLVPKVNHLQQLDSEYRSTLLKLNENGNLKGPRPFRFISAWQQHSGFQDMLIEAWSHGIERFTMIAREWNTSAFGNITYGKKKLLARISGVEKALKKAPSNALIELERDLKVELIMVLADEESLWYQKSRSKWLFEVGVRKIRFHSKKSKKFKFRINRIELF